MIIMATLTRPCSQQAALKPKGNRPARANLHTTQKPSEKCAQWLLQAVVARHRNKQSTGQHVTSRSLMAVCAVQQLMNAFHRAASNVQLVWWYILFVQNKFGQGEIQEQLAFKTRTHNKN